MDQAKADRLSSQSLTRNEWIAVIASLQYTSRTYVLHHSGVNLERLADQIQRDMPKED